MKWNERLGYNLWLLLRSLNLIKLGESSLTTLGVLWLLIEIFVFFNNQEKADQVKSIWWLFLIIGIIVPVYKNWPKNKFSYKVNNRDVCITIQIGDIFQIEGALIIPVNNQLDVDKGGIVSRSSSTLRFFIDKFYQKKNSHLAQDIEDQIKNSKSWYSNYVLSENPKTYKIGTVIPITQDEKQFYLLCNSTLNEQNRSESTEDDLSNSLIGLWTYLSHCGSKDNLVIPIIGTGRGRISISREQVIKEIVLSFLSSLSMKSYCEQLTICIYPKDIKNQKMDIEGITDFVRLHCMHANFSKKNDTPQGQTIT